MPNLAKSKPRYNKKKDKQMLGKCLVQFSVYLHRCFWTLHILLPVMRLLGIPCRVVTNFQSAHDNNRNLIIDVYHADYGVREKTTRDSVW